MKNTQKSNLSFDDSEPTSFSILMHSDYFKKSIEQIIKELNRQKRLEDQVFESVVKIGKLLQELKDHTNNLNIKGKNKLLESFENNLPISPRIIAKYISVFSNPKHSPVNHKENLPNSITSIHEISLLDALELLILKEGGEV